jgi:dipeptidyl aminopeptidase/acylaminoacyl peptidase
MRIRRFVLAALFLAASGGAGAKEPPELKTTPLAEAFGSAPVMWGVQLSPDGRKLSALQAHPTGVTIARVVDLEGGASQVVLSSKRDEFDISWCDWANGERLLCGVRALTPIGAGQYAAVTRLVATQADGSQMRVLLERRLQDTFTQFQDRIVDWLPDDPEHVLVQIPTTDGSGVARLNVYDGSIGTVDRARAGAYTWISDGHGNPRLLSVVGERERRWFVRETPDSDWSLLHERPLTDGDDSFSPIGFGDDPNALLFYELHEGRTALFAMDLAKGRERRLVYSHDTFDVAAVHSLGKYERLVAAAYHDDRPRLHFFDDGLAKAYGALTRLFPDKIIAITDESWDQRYYLVFVSSAEDPGTYYRFDTATNELGRITVAYSSLADRKLAVMRPIRYAAEDGVEVPAYLTLPETWSAPGPAVVLPHGGPSARDYWTYDFLAQYLAASGYAVLQSNYRGSDGYGASWVGEGGFRGWRRAVADITAGARYLAAEGIADPDRICAVGWSYGGYASLLSAIENSSGYRCVVSIAGVTDPKALSFAMLNYVGGRSAAAFIGTGAEVYEQGSPVDRAEELTVPVLLVHARKDINVPFAQSASLERALSRAGKDVELVEYEHAEHSITPERYRIDLLTRLGEFLAAHLD